MKAWVLNGIGNLTLQKVAAPIPKNDEVLVKVKCAGICSSDISRIFTTGAYYFPIILGHEFSGETVDGKRVGVFPLIPCFACKACKAGNYETCSNYGYIGSRQDGAFAEYVCVPNWNLVEIPSDISYEEAALLEPAAVALHAVRKLDLSKVTNCAVVGTGTIGKLIVCWLEILGIKHVMVIGRNDFLAKQFDACIEAVGSKESLEKCINIVRSNGQLILVGNPTIDFKIEQKLYWLILRKQLIVRGSWNSSYPKDWNFVLESARRLQLSRFISHRYQFDELDKGVNLIFEHNVQHGKVIINDKSNN